MNSILVNQILANIKLYFFRVAIAVDQLGNALLNGEPDETLSSRAYRADQDNKILGKIFRPIIDFIFKHVFNDPDHCYQSYLSETEQKQLPKNFYRYIKTNK